MKTEKRTVKTERGGPGVWVLIPRDNDEEEI